MSKWLALSILLSTLAYVALRGGKAERLVLSILVTNFAITYILYAHSDMDWRTPQYSVFVLDTLTLIILLVFSLRSKRFWPLLVSAAAAMPPLTFLVGSFGQGLVSEALGITQSLWGNIQLIVLMLASYRHHQRTKPISS